MEILAVVLLVLAGLLWWLAGRARQRSGLPAGRVVYSDTGGWERAPKALFSRRDQLTGKPDYLVRQGQQIIPVEVKSMRAPAGGPLPQHVFQLAAYCALVEAAYEQRPAYGLIKYADQIMRVDYTRQLEADLRAVLADMRANAEAGELHRSHTIPARCRACGFREQCVERLDQ